MKAGGLAQGAMGLAGRAASSAPGQFIGGALSNVGSFMNAGAGALGSMWGPMASGFGGLLSGALPIVGVISGIIAVVSILGDHLEDIRNIVGNVFGDAGLAVFDTFIGGLQRIGDFITGLFQDGNVAAAMAPLRDAITGMFGDDAGAAFDGLVQVLQGHRRVRASRTVRRKWRRENSRFTGKWILCCLPKRVGARNGF